MVCIRSGRATDRRCAHRPAAHTGRSHLPPSPDIHPHEPRVCGGEEDDWTDGQHRNIRPFRPGASSKDRSGRTMNPGLPRQGDIETPATVARYEEPAEVPVSSGKRAQPPCRRSDHAKTPIKLPDSATSGVVPLLLTTIVPAFRTGIRSDFHWKISRSSALQISDRDSMKTMRKIFSMTIRCSTQKVYGQGFGCSA